jgi:class 3 adenylate cyclase
LTAPPNPLTPSGTVTFLFTDIEGSTRLWQGDETAMRKAVARHDQLARMLTLRDQLLQLLPLLGSAKKV